MFVRWEVGVCAVLALCSVSAIPQKVPIGPNSGIRTSAPLPITSSPTTLPPPPPPTTQNSDCGLPSHRPVTLDTYAATWSTMTSAQENNFSSELVGYSTPLDTVISNDGDSVYVDFPDMDPNDAPHMEWKVQDTIIWQMNLTRLSFHQPSEHPIDGRKAFMELHMEHKDAQGRTWILAYNYDICSPPRRDFDVISEASRNVSNPGSSAPLPGFVLQSLMPYGRFDHMVMCDYFLYEFSESPSMEQCAPSVFWMVYRYPQCVSEEQMNVGLLDDKGGDIVHLDEPLPLVEGVPATYLTCF